jgi:hypothetical protein
MVEVKQYEPELPDLAPIFSAPVRWGFEFAPPGAIVLSPERDHPPAVRQVTTLSAAATAGIDQLTNILFAAVGITLLLSIILLAAHGGAVYFVVSLVAAGTSIWAAATFRSKTRLGVAGPGTGEVIALVVTSFLIPPLGLLIQALRTRGYSALLRQQQVPDPKDQAAARREHEKAVVDWQRRVTEFEQSEQNRRDKADYWFPVVPSPASHLICAFGGSSRTWAFALAAIGASMLGSGRRVFIVDVSRRTSVDGLWELAKHQGYPVSPRTLPSQSPMLPPFEGMTWDSLTAILSEVSHSAQRDAAVSRHERQEDRAVLREVAGGLDQDAPVSLTRLKAALHAVGSAAAPQGESAISDDEYDRLTALYNDVQRQHGGVMERVTRLERMLRVLRSLESSAAGQAEPVDSGASVRIMSIDKRADELDSEILSDLFFQLLLHSMRVSTVDADFMILLGADRISRNSLETLGTYAEREGVPTLLFFEHLRDDAVQVIGGGGAAAVFFALANHHEAKEAAEFIGSQYKWVESQHTRSYSESITRSHATQETESQSTSTTRGLTHTRGSSHSWGGSGDNRTFNSGRSSSISDSLSVSDSYTVSVGETLSEAIARSEEYSSSEQRVREAVIEPEVLMGLPVTGAICVEIQPDGRRIATNVDCHPKINYIPRVSKTSRGQSAERLPMPT